MKLFSGAIAKWILGVLLTGLCVFLPAGTFAFPNGWLLMGVLFVPMFAGGILLFFRNPDLLQKRLQAKEEQKPQRFVILASGLMFILGFTAAGLTFRFGKQLPYGISVGAAIVFLAAYFLFWEVLRENTYLSRTVVVQENQTVIDTGLYGVVRHPMYGATLLLFLSMPFILGSLYAFLLFLIYPFLLVRRIQNEEALLEKELPGYRAYKEKVRYRLIPFIW